VLHLPQAAAVRRMERGRGRGRGALQRLPLRRRVE
jgi:hypothetical protein